MAPFPPSLAWVCVGNKVTLEEFIDGIMRCKGSARAIDQVWTKNQHSMARWHHADWVLEVLGIKVAEIAL